MDRVRDTYQTAKVRRYNDDERGQTEVIWACAEGKCGMREMRCWEKNVEDRAAIQVKRKAREKFLESVKENVQVAGETGKVQKTGCD